MKKTVSALFAVSVLFAAAPAFADNDRQYYEQNRSQFISHEQAAQAAVAAVGGGQMKDVDFEYEHGRAYFDVEVQKNHQQWDVVIDARSGKVLSKRLDD